MFLWDGNAIIIETCFDGVFVEVNKGFVVGVKKNQRVSLFLSFGSVWRCFFGFLFPVYLQHLEAITLLFTWYLRDFAAKTCQST